MASLSIVGWTHDQFSTVLPANVDQTRDACAKFLHNYLREQPAVNGKLFIVSINYCQSLHNLFSVIFRPDFRKFYLV